MDRIKYKFDTNIFKYEKKEVFIWKIILGYILLTISLFIFLIISKFIFKIDLLLNSIFRTFLILSFCISAFTLLILILLNYLNRSNIDSKNSQLERSLSKLQDKVDELSKDTPKLDEAKLYNYIKQNLEKDVFKALENIAKNTIHENKKEEFFDDLYRSEDRLTIEIANTTRRANLNLVIGILSTIVGISAFGLIIYKTPIDQELVIGYYFPRICLIIFTQIFSYFFLRLYKKGLEDSKYYHNELTSIESKISAIQFSNNIIEDKELKTIIVKAMMQNDRNNNFSENSTNNSIEMEKLNKNESLDKVIELLKNISKV